MPVHIRKATTIVEMADGTIRVATMDRPDSVDITQTDVRPPRVDPSLYPNSRLDFPEPRYLQQLVVSGPEITVRWLEEADQPMPQETAP